MIRWRNKNLRGQFCGKHFPIFEMLDAKIAHALNKIIDRSPPSSTTSFEWLALIMPYWITPIYSRLLFMTITFRMGWCFTVCVRESIPWYLGKSVQIENTWVWETQKLYWNCTTWDSSEDIGAQLSKIEDNGEAERRSETSITELWRQKREDWNRSSCQESKGIEWRWRRKRYLLRETNAVSGMRVKIMHKTDTESCHTFWAMNVTRLKCVERQK